MAAEPTTPPKQSRHLEVVDTDQPDERTPPHDTRAERALLGLCLTQPHLLDELTLTSDDFYQPVHAWWWEQLTKLHRDATNTGAPLGPVTVNAALMADAKDYTRYGGAPYLFELVDQATTEPPGTAPYLARIIREHTRARHLLSLGQRLTQLGHNARGGGDLDQALIDATDHVENLLRDQLFGPTTATPLHQDLTWLLTGQQPTVEPPQHCTRTDGHALFYTGRVNGIFGDPEAAKSWLALTTIVEALHRGQRAALIDVDHNGQQLTVEHLLLLGARPDQLANPDLFRYYEPEDGDDLRAAVTQLTVWRPVVAVLDSIGEMMPMLGVKSGDNDEITNALRIIANPLSQVGACVITIDHQPKSAEARATGFAIGGTAKKRAIDGSYIHAEARTQPAPGQLGRVTLRIEKDRPGRLRAVCTGKYAGTFVLDSTQPNIITARIDVTSAINSAGIFRPTHLMEAVSRYVEDCTASPSGKAIKDHVTGKGVHVDAAIARLVEEGYLAAVGGGGPGKTTKYSSIAVYREAEDAEA